MSDYDERAAKFDAAVDKNATENAAQQVQAKITETKIQAAIRDSNLGGNVMYAQAIDDSMRAWTDGRQMILADENGDIFVAKAEKGKLSVSEVKFEGMSVAGTKPLSGSKLADTLNKFSEMDIEFSVGGGTNEKAAQKYDDISKDFKAALDKALLGELSGQKKDQSKPLEAMHGVKGDYTH